MEKNDLSVVNVKVNVRFFFFQTGPKSSVLHTKSQGHWPFGFGEEDCTIYG